MAESKQPSDLYLLGTDGQMYRHKDGNLELIEEGSENVEVDGFGFEYGQAESQVPAPVDNPEEASDVAGHDLKGCSWHTYTAWGWVFSYNHSRNVYRPHRHPWGDARALIY